MNKLHNITIIGNNNIGERGAKLLAENYQLLSNLEELLLRRN